ncbi:UDP-glucose 4-epimerase [sediment metagenome]|uniref:UDP-glucose 4-epimerase n=1 Tax=sediment metagenome TaxID=749907 RepID=D9PGC2_9ZZZZ
MNILITGGAGFIGSNLALSLLKNGHQITVLDILSPQIHGTEPDKSPLFNSIKNKVKFIHGDVRDKTILMQALENIDIVCHLAAETGTGQSMYDIARYTDVNVQGTAVLLQAIADGKFPIKKIFLSSSRTIYGEGSYLCESCGCVVPHTRKAENMAKGIWSLACPHCNSIVHPCATKEDSPPDPQSIYAITKYCQELLISRFCNAYSIPYSFLRYQNVYGPGQSLSNPYTGVLSVFTTRLFNNKALEVFEDGKESRDFVFIEDVVRATVKAVESDKANNQIINIGSGCATTIFDLANLLASQLNPSIKPVINGKFRAGDIFTCWADISRARELLDYSPQVLVKEGVKRFAEWARSQAVVKDTLDKALKEMADKGLYR